MATTFWLRIFGYLAVFTLFRVSAENPYRFYTWTATYGNISVLGTPQQVILINEQFPGPTIDVVTNDNIVLNLFNNLDEPFLLTWNGIKQRKNSWQDGVLGTNCPIPPGGNYTYVFQAKDQIGTYSYFPSTQLHKAAGGYGAFIVHKRPQIPIPHPIPDGDFNLLVGDWYKANHKVLRQSLDAGASLPFPDGILINGKRQAMFTGVTGKTYMFRFSNIGLSTSLNVLIQGHKMKLVEVEGSQSIQTMYDSLDVHVGQSVAVLVTLDQPSKDYFIAISARFTNQSLLATAVLHYGDSTTSVSGLPPSPSYGLEGSMAQARSFRWNLTASAARPNPQGSFHYGTIPISRTIKLANTPVFIAGKQRFGVNGVSYVNPDTPLKLADHFNISGVFSLNTVGVIQSGGAPSLGTTVLGLNLHDFVEIVLQNNEKTMQSWHLDGYDFWVVGFGSGQWSPDSRTSYNLVDALTRHTAQVFPESWTTILVSLDNQGMWNMRSAAWDRQYLGQQLYMRVWTSEQSLANEKPIPANALRCGKAVFR